MAKTKENNTQSPTKKKAKPKPEEQPEASQPDENATISQIVNGALDKKKKKKVIKKDEDHKEESDCKFPMNRIKRIVKSEDSGVHVAQDSIFLINKATERFLELFSKEAYACATLDKKKHIEYKHLASVVSKQKKFVFLSDFVPEKLKVKDALAEMSSGEA